MTAHELAKKLLAGPDVMVTISGYEGGVNEVMDIEEPKDLALNVYDEWYYGKHEYLRYHDQFELRSKVTIQAVHLSSSPGLESLEVKA